MYKFNKGDRVKLHVRIGSIARYNNRDIVEGDVGTVKEFDACPLVEWDRTGKTRAILEGNLAALSDSSCVADVCLAGCDVRISAPDNTPHKCTEEWIEVLKNGCKCGGI